MSEYVSMKKHSGNGIFHQDPLLETQELCLSYPPESAADRRAGRRLQAVKEVSLQVFPGESLGLVGESGCGKSSLGRCLLRLEEPTGGRILLGKTDITHLSQKQLRPHRRQIQMIFQDPWSSLNPRMTVLQSVTAPLTAFHIGTSAAQREEAAMDLLRQIGLNEAQARKYPHEMSGGQRQRVAIARAMVCRPDFVVCDEPVSALDASIRAQILNLMKDLQRQNGATYLFISHDLSVVRFLCNRVVVMYLGQVVEEAETTRLFDFPRHPYTQALLSAIPVPKVRSCRSRILLSGDPPDPMNPPAGCPFRTRCPRAADCPRPQEPPPMHEVEPGHRVACHLT